MPAERGKDAAERFAAAVDRGRSPRLNGGDADLARELGIAARLRSAEGSRPSHTEAVAMLRSTRAAEFSPTADEKARAKQRLMALLAEPEARGEVVEFPAGAASRTAPIPVVPAGGRGSDRAEPWARRAPEVAAEAGPAGPADAEVAQVEAERPDADEKLARVTLLASRRGRHTRLASDGRARRRSARSAPSSGLVRRAGLVSSAAVLVMVAFSGAGVFVSRDALPGQTLYPLKRAAEAAGLAMTFDDEARARRNLDLAAIRLSEIEQLIALRGSSGIDPQLVTAAMSEFDVATSEGTRALLSRDGRAGTLQAWAATQSARIEALKPALPDPAVSAADTSIALLERLLGQQPSVNTADPDADPTDVRTPGGPSTSRVPGTSGGDGDDATEQDDQSGLPALQPDQGPLVDDPASTTEPTPTDTAPANGTGHDPVRLPLPLPGAPVTLPPLLPGMPGLTVG